MRKPIDMKTKHIGTLIIAPVVLALAGVSFAQNFAINSFKIAGGGGTCSNGQFFLSGAIGQPDAGGPMTNGQYSLTGGFWALPTAIQMPGAPTLNIVPAGPGQVTISWSPGARGYRLQETPGLSPAHWVDSSSGTNNPVTLPVTTPAKFFRLIKWCEEDC